MPKFSPTGHLAAGIAGAGVSVDLVYIDEGGGTCWLDDETALYQTTDGQDRWFLRVYNRVTKTRTNFDTLGANFLIAGGGRWAAHLVGYGVYGSLGHYPFASVRAAGFDGTLALCDHYQIGLGVTLYAPDGTITRGAADSHCYGLRVLAPDDAIYIDEGGSGRIVTVKGRRFTQAADAMSPALVVLDDGEWLIYYTSTWGIIAHPALADTDPAPIMGYVIGPPEQAYNYDVRASDGTHLQIVYSTTQGERPQDLVTVLFSTDAPRTNFTPIPVPPPVVRLVLAPTSGPAPLTVAASLVTLPESGSIDAIRYRKDGALDGGNDVYLHEFVFPTAGTHAVYASAAGPGGVTHTTPQTITVLPKPVGLMRGLVAGFDDPISYERLQWFVSQGVQSVRTGVGTTDAANAAIIAQLAKFPSIEPYYSIRFGALDELRRVPEGGRFEPGNEPNLAGITPAAYAQWANSIRGLCAANSLTPYWGSISNLNRDGLNWLAEVLRLCPWMDHLAIHRYNYGAVPNVQASQWGSRANEMSELVSIIGTRAFRVTEIGCKCGPRCYSTGAWFWKRWHAITEQQQLDYVRAETALWRAMPMCGAVYYYQERSAAPSDYGFDAMYTPGASGKHRRAWEVFRG